MLTHAVLAYMPGSHTLGLRSQLCACVKRCKLGLPRHVGQVRPAEGSPAQLRDGCVKRQIAWLQMTESTMRCMRSAGDQACREQSSVHVRWQKHAAGGHWEALTARRQYALAQGAEDVLLQGLLACSRLVY